MQKKFDEIGLTYELQAMPEYELVLRLESFTTSIFIFDQNYYQLRSLIEHLNHAPESDPIFTLRNRTQLQSALLHLIRLIHNYVAAAQSLIDHTRIFYRKFYEDTGKFPDYQERVEREFLRDPLAQFVKCLRQYCQHYRAPNLGMTFYFDRGDGTPIVKFSLLKSDLKQFDGWNRPAQEYLASVDSEIDILNLATAYKTKVESFYRWFEKRLADIHQVELSRFKEKEQQLLLLQIERNIAVHLAPRVHQRAQYPDEIFLSTFTANDFDYLDKTTSSPLERAQAAIALCQANYFQLPDDTQRRIIEVYMRQ